MVTVRDTVLHIVCRIHALEVVNEKILKEVYELPDTIWFWCYFGILWHSLLHNKLFTYLCLARLKLRLYGAIKLYLIILLIYLYVKCGVAGLVDCDPTTMFDCSHGAREKCIPLKSVCDKTDDCDDSVDESPELCANHSESVFIIIIIIITRLITH